MSVLLVFSGCQKSPPQEFAARRRQRNLIVFPAACTWEKLFARSERRIVCRRQTTEAQNEAMLIQKRCEASFLTSRLRPNPQSY